MDITGKIIAVCPQQGGTSKAGKEWKSQTFVLETEEQYPRKIAFELFGNRLDEFGAACQMGAKVNVSFDIESREFNGRWYTSVRAWRVATGENTQTAPAQESASFGDFPPAPAESEPFGDSSKNSDLPF